MLKCVIRNKADNYYDSVNKRFVSEPTAACVFESSITACKTFKECEFGEDYRIEVISNLPGGRPPAVEKLDVYAIVRCEESYASLSGPLTYVSKRDAETSVRYADVMSRLQQIHNEYPDAAIVKVKEKKGSDRYYISSVNGYYNRDTGKFSGKLSRSCFFNTRTEAESIYEVTGGLGTILTMPAKKVPRARTIKNELITKPFRDYRVVRDDGRFLTSSGRFTSRKAAGTLFTHEDASEAQYQWKEKGITTYVVHKED